MIDNDNYYSQRTWHECQKAVQDIKRFRRIVQPEWGLHALCQIQGIRL